MLPPRKHTTPGDAGRITRLAPRTAGSQNGDGRGTSRTVRERVRLVAERLGHPAPADTTLLVVQSEAPQFSYHPPGLLQGLIEGARAARCRLEMAIVPDDQLQHEAGLQALLAQTAASGLLFNYHHGYPRALPELIERLTVPTLWINSLHRNDCVMPGDFDAAVTLTRHLLALGHRRIAYADLTNDFTAHALHHSCLERLDGYKQAMLEAGYRPRLIGVELPLDAVEQRELIGATLTDEQAPSAVIAYCPRSLMPFYHQALTGLQLRVPGDLSLATFVNDDHEITGIDVTRMANPWLDVGHAAVTRLVARCAQPGKRFDPLMVPMPLITGSTCGPRQGTGRLTRQEAGAPA